MSLSFFPAHTLSSQLATIAEKVAHQERITNQEALFLLDQAPISFLGVLANEVRARLHGNKVYFNKNIHIEPTNICVFDCKFCSYSRLLSKKEEAWEYSIDQMLEMLKDAPEDITEVHIVGGVHPKMGLHFYEDLIQKAKAIRPEVHVKAFTAVELEYICRKAKVSYQEGLQRLKDAGQGSLPGGGAEIFDEEIRKEICEDKCTTKQWLEIHRTAHQIGMPSNATMLYGHSEQPIHLIDHLDRLRKLQDETGGFNAFIPLKFRNKHNQMSHIQETPFVHDVKVFAISRIFLDNFAHIKAYWPMIGKTNAQTLLSFGVNDIDGTIDDTTKIYSMAGAEDQHPRMTTEEILHLIKNVGFVPVERDTLYNEIKTY